MYSKSRETENDHRTENGNAVKCNAEPVPDKTDVKNGIGIPRQPNRIAALIIFIVAVLICIPCFALVIRSPLIFDKLLRTGWLLCVTSIFLASKMYETETGKAMLSGNLNVWLLILFALLNLFAYCLLCGSDIIPPAAFIAFLCSFIGIILLIIRRIPSEFIGTKRTTTTNWEEKRINGKLVSTRFLGSSTQNETIWSKPGTSEAIEIGTSFILIAMLALQLGNIASILLGDKSGYLLKQFPPPSIPEAGAKTIDMEGNVYPTVVIGKQEWMTKNLNTGFFRNGDPIPQVTSWKEWDTMLPICMSTDHMTRKDVRPHIGLLELIYHY